MQYVSALNIPTLIQYGALLVCPIETKDEKNNLLLFREKQNTLERLWVLCYDIA